MTLQERKKTKFRVSFAFLFSVGLAILPLISYAAIVPSCGGVGQAACSYCDLLQLVKNVMDFMLYLVFPLATIGIIVGGFNIMLAAGSTSRVQKGRQYITAAVVGILIALLAWTVLDTILKVISPNFEVAALGPWKELRCAPLPGPKT